MLPPQHALGNMRGGETLSAVRSGGDDLEGIATLRADIIALLRERRYEETLAALYRARSESPSDLALQKGIEQLKEFLSGTYAKRLGGLDRVATPIPLSAVRSPDAVLLARYIDGSSTYGDLAQMCPLGQLRTLQVLVGLYCGTEPPRVYGLEQPRIVGADAARGHQDPAPASGLRVPDEPFKPPALESTPPASDRPPDTPRSGAVAIAANAVLSEETRRYNELFTRGTAAFVQARYGDAAEAFEACLRLRPDDRAAAVMLRRALGEGRSR